MMSTPVRMSDTSPSSHLTIVNKLHENKARMKSSQQENATSCMEIGVLELIPQGMYNNKRILNNT